MKDQLFSSEAELCAAFSAWAQHQGWTPYAETGGWDIVLVAPDGTQIGVQAKLRFNMAVLQQTIESGAAAWQRSGPDYRAVLLPKNFGTDTICGALGIVAISAATGIRGGTRFYPDLNHSSDWHYWNPERRIDLPEYIPDVRAGASAPVQLTRWKIGALRIAAVVESRGYVTRADFKRFGIDPRRWTAPGGWLRPGQVPGQWIAGDNMTFAAHHPVVYPQVLANIRAELAGSTTSPL